MMYVVYNINDVCGPYYEPHTSLIE